MYKLVKNSPLYWDFIKELRNNEENQKGFVEKVKITSDQQKKYMSKHNDDYYICLLNNIPAGFIGVIDKDIRVCTDPAHKKKGVGEFMVNEIMKIYPKAFAKIFIENIASIRLFEKCGFKKRYFILEKHES